MEEEYIQGYGQIPRVDKRTMRIVDKLSNVDGGSEDLSIYRVPSKLRKVTEDAYNPRVVSIGPLHRDNPDPIAMKEHKWRYMLFILQQTDSFEKTIECLKNCTDAIYCLNTKVRENYAEDLTKMKEEDLAEIMLVDGCFVLELFLRYDRYCSDIPLKHQSNDPIFSSSWMLPILRHDLTLLENQIPFFILEKLYYIIKPHMEYTPPETVASLALKFFQPMHQQTIEEGTDTEDCKHLLHLLHNFFRPTSDHIIEVRIIEVEGPAKPSNQQTKKKVRPRKVKKNKFKLCASDLYDGGVQFETGSTDSQLLSINFDSNRGVIQIPPLFIDDTTDSLIRNLIAFEQCHLRSSYHITSNVIVMKSLIRSEEDIKLLKKQGIITEEVPEGNYLRDDDFESILNHINLKEFCFDQLCDEVNIYSKSLKFYLWYKFKARLRRYMKSLHDTYFSSPRSIIAFLAAAVVFYLTVTQTRYTIHPR